ncbi:MAG: hypothetical protein WC989_07635 [Micavibrio sp.]
MIRLGQSMDGRLILGSSQPFPADIKYVEYYREQRLFSLVFDMEEEESALMPYEITCETADIVTASPNIMIVAMAEPGAEPYGYMVPLIQIGIC